VSIVLVATITPLPEHKAEVGAALQAAVGSVHAEDGCELYALHEAADRFVIIEKWASQDALTVHRTAPALAALGQALRGKVAGPPDVAVLTPLPAGDARQGQV
jgi:quinol monooxygenase YgiN